MRVRLELRPEELARTKTQRVPIPGKQKRNSKAPEAEMSLK